MLWDMAVRLLRRVQSIQLCVDAATEITKHVNYINDAGELYSTLFRYGVVLRDLRLEVLRNNTYLAPVSNPRAGNCLTSNENNEILPVPYRRSQLRPEGGTSGSKLAVEQAAEGAPFCRSFPCFSRRTLQYDKLGTIRFTGK
ncbi:hypothetical protein CPAR01_11977 [Colletotrichum paranaense]|uniref:Uncharacterized protein n=1 Tax=Colletotrichum paranaense TaxID=1914294 RepID=A0ABQ9S8M8_9PEZI|nr:uncharacterized protein CPAR01_11977 [Colletotrichum paranaense]KAK1529665.1 hypothetical protein CPAR01_11977 [Colletotrichum paranaense]